MIGVAALLAASVGSCPAAAPAGVVMRRAAFGGVIAPTPADADAALAAGRVARAGANRFLGLDVPPFLIAPAKANPSPVTGGCAFVFAWPFARQRPPTHVLPHEIGHALFIRYLVPRRGLDEYGGAAPDWLDEMAAIACEDAAGVAMRRAEARRHAADGALIPLARLLSMPHPEFSARTADNAVSRQGMRTPRSIDTPAYYATVRALFDFLIERTGNERIIAVLAGQVRAGKPLDRWLIARLGDGSGVERLASLDIQLARFVLLDPRFGDVGALR